MAGVLGRMGHMAPVLGRRTVSPRRSISSVADSELISEEFSGVIPYSLANHVLPVSPRRGWNRGVTKSIFNADTSATFSSSRYVDALGLSVGEHVGRGSIATRRMFAPLGRTWLSAIFGVRCAAHASMNPTSIELEGILNIRPSMATPAIE